MQIIHFLKEFEVKMRRFVIFSLFVLSFSAVCFAQSGRKIAPKPTPDQTIAQPNKNENEGFSESKPMPKRSVSPFPSLKNSKNGFQNADSDPDQRCRNSQRIGRGCRQGRNEPDHDSGFGFRPQRALYSRSVKR